MTIKSVLYFGSYDPNYSRNRIIKKGLEANGIKVLEDKAEGSILTRYFRLLVTFLKLRNQVGAIIVGFPGHYDVPLAFLLGKFFAKKVFFDIFASTYETYVIDRKVIAKKSFQAKFYYFLDWLGLKLADYVIIDTKAHGNYYKALYGLKPNKTVLVYVGSDPDYFHPRKLKEETDVLFYGSYQPLQGTDVIIRAAAKLPEVKFKMIGEGQERKSAEYLAKILKLKNVEFVNWLSLENLALEISKAKICLGIFGKSQKAEVIIPNKVFDAMSSARTVITSDTKAIKELTDLYSDCIALVESNNPLKLAKQISNLLQNGGDRVNFVISDYKLFKSYLIPKLIVKNLCSYIIND